MNLKLFITGWILIFVGIAILFLAPFIEFASKSHHPRTVTISNATGVVCIAPFFIPICIGYGTSTTLMMLAILTVLILFIVFVLLMFWIVKRLSRIPIPGVEP